MNRKVIKQYGNCEVTLSFQNRDSETMSRVMWLLIESFCDRTGLQLEQDDNSENKVAS
ncbi:MAG: hypothetical protein K2N60_10755 [Oscillospiraceae bacterium]|nr:hypothetical protein [Oscillospiraceae bacterium]